MSTAAANRTQQQRESKRVEREARYTEAVVLAQLSTLAARTLKKVSVRRAIDVYDDVLRSAARGRNLRIIAAAGVLLEVINAERESQRAAGAAARQRRRAAPAAAVVPVVVAAAAVENPLRAKILAAIEAVEATIVARDYRNNLHMTLANNKIVVLAITTWTYKNVIEQLQSLLRELDGGADVSADWN